jgi:hypothetical protein
MEHALAGGDAHTFDEVDEYIERFSGIASSAMEHRGRGWKVKRDEPHPLPSF